MLDSSTCPVAAHRASGVLGAGAWCLPTLAIASAVVVGFAAFEVVRGNASVTFGVLPLGPILIAAFALAPGALVGRGALWARCRAPRWATLMGLVAGTLGVLAIGLGAALGLQSRLGEPASIGGALLAPWSTTAAAVSGAFLPWRDALDLHVGLVLIGLFAASLAIGANALLGSVWLDRAVFCESCGRWAKTLPRVDLPMSRSGRTLELVERIGLDGLRHDVAPEQPRRWLRLRAQVCECEETAAYRLELVERRSGFGRGPLAERASPLGGLRQGQARELLALAGSGRRDAASRPVVRPTPH